MPGFAPSPPGEGDRDAARITIVGGGYSGAAAALQLARAARGRATITIVEPRAELGRGMAYSTADPDHRLNGPLDNHLLDPAHPDHLRRWCERRGILATDREALAANGGIYLRRGDFGTYIGEALRGHGADAIRHYRASAVGLGGVPEAPEVLTEDGARIASDAVVIATGNAPAALPAALSPIAGHPSFVRNPFDAQRLGSIAPRARVLLVGGGLTALDVISTLLRRGHRGPITALSRHGVTPRPHRAKVPENAVSIVLARIDGPPPAYVEEALRDGGVRALSVQLRRRIAEARAAGGDWQVPFDELRDVVWQFWPRLPLAQKRRFLRHLRTWYDAHRFRAPPQNEALARAGELAGQIRYVAARVRETRPLGGGGVAVRWAERATHREAHAECDVVVNCTGLDPACGARSNPFLAALIDDGVLRPDPTGIGFEVDAQCRPVGRDGAPAARLRVVGPPSAGTFGDPLGVIFIAPQVRRMVPGLLADLGIMAQ